jgi:hypothetical protein
MICKSILPLRYHKDNLSYSMNAEYQTFLITDQSIGYQIIFLYLYEITLFYLMRMEYVEKLPLRAQLIYWGHYWNRWFLDYINRVLGKHSAIYLLLWHKLYTLRLFQVVYSLQILYLKYLLLSIHWHQGCSGDTSPRYVFYIVTHLIFFCLYKWNVSKDYEDILGKRLHYIAWGSHDHKFFY